MPEIRYSFKAIGADGVKRQFDGIAEAARRAATAQRQASAGARGGARSSPEQAAAREARAVEKAAQAKQRAAEREAKSVAKSEADKTRAIEREAQKRQRAQEREVRAKERAMQQERRALERSERDIERNVARMQRAKEQASRPKGNSRLRNAVRQETSRGAFVGSLAASAVTGIASIGYGIGQDIAGASVRRNLELEDKAIALSKAGRLSGKTAVDPATLKADAESTARSVKGTKATDILDAQAKFVTMTGDLEQARSLSKTFAVTARATGSREEDIASTAATLRDKFGVSSEKEMQEALAKLIFQGKSGAFELSDASRYFTEMGAAGSRFGLDKGSKGIEQLGGLAQISRMSTGSGAEASTAVIASLRQLVAQSDRIKKLTGANVFTDETRSKTRDVYDVLVDTIAGSGGDLTKLQKIFGEEGIKGISKLIEVFNQASNAAGKNASQQERVAAGTAAMRKMLSDATNAGGSWAEVMKDAEAQAKSTTDGLTTAFEKIQGDMGEILGPAFATIAENADLVSAALAPFAHLVADGVEVIGLFADKLREIGLLEKKDDKAKISTLTGAQSEREGVTARLSELAKIEKQFGGLTGEQRLEKRKLADRNVFLKQEEARLGGPSSMTRAETADYVTSLRDPKKQLSGIRGGFQEAFASLVEMKGQDTSRPAALIPEKSNDDRTMKTTSAVGPLGGMAAPVIDGLRGLLGGNDKAAAADDSLAKMSAAIKAQLEGAAATQEASSALKEAAAALKSSAGNRVAGDPVPVQ